MNAFGDDFDSSDTNELRNPAPESVLQHQLTQNQQQQQWNPCPLLGEESALLNFPELFLHQNKNRWPPSDETSRRRSQVPPPPPPSSSSSCSSRIDAERGHVLRKKKTNKRRKMDVKSSCSDISDAHSAISGALSLSSSASSSDREEQMISENSASCEMLNPPTDTEGKPTDEKAQYLNPEAVEQLASYFYHLHKKDPSFFSEVQYDDDGKAKAFFWTDGSSKSDWQHFGDVLILNTTFKMDNCGVICAPFIGLNHHRQYVLFSCAFLIDETTDSLVWLLQAFAKAMDSIVQPKTVLTNESLSVSDAIKQVFPKAKHQIGFWHILRKIESFSKRRAAPDTQSFFERFKCQTKEEFCSWWRQLLNGFEICDRPCIDGLYESREKWAPVFNKKTFIAGILDTTDINGTFQRFTREAKTLSKFVEEYLQLAVQQRKKEALGDREILLKNNMLEQQANRIYTCTTFMMFQKELVQSLHMQIEKIYGDETAAKYMLRHEEGKYIVEFNCSDSSAVCSCSMYESVGILCCHVLKVFRERNVCSIPPQYILKRWTMFAKDHMSPNAWTTAVVEPIAGK